MEEQTHDEKPEREETMDDLEVPEEQAEDVTGGKIVITNFPPLKG